MPRLEPTKTRRRPRQATASPQVQSPPLRGRGTPPALEGVGQRLHDLKALPATESRELLKALYKYDVAPHRPAAVPEGQKVVVHVVFGASGKVSYSTQVTSGQVDLAQSLLDAAPLKPDERLLELRRTLTQRTVDSVLQGTRWLSPSELNEVRHAKTTNPSHTVKRWIDSQRIFALERGGARLIPAYALDELGEPVPILQEVLKLMAGRSPFRIAAWFESPTGYLEGQRPRDLLATDGLAVVKAAEQSLQGPLHG